MATYSINAAVLKKVFIAGAYNLEKNKAWINDLNVFPVPDGDTGTNMTMTILSAVQEIQALSGDDMKQLAKAMSFGSLRGARGNSGVILSQLLRGFCKEIGDKEELDAFALANAFRRAVETAYKAVMKPKEGTILTVARGMADKAAELAPVCDTLEDFFEQIIAHGDEVLAYTPELLPVLKQAGVVDSGGQGLMQVMKGAYDALLGRETAMPAPEAVQPSRAATSEIADSSSLGDITFGYCTEFLIRLEKTYGEAQEQEFKSYLEGIGDSLVVVSDEDIVKVHVHTNDPGLAIQKALTFGSLTNMKIDNMRVEHEEKLIREASKIAAEETKSQPRKETGFIAVCAGDGLAGIFKELGADYVIAGGQTMNPSTDDMLKAIDKVNADTIFIFPNNKNIILAAEQAMHMTEDKKIVVIPTKTVPEGISALIGYMPERAAEENAEAMKEAMAAVKSGSVTYAVRNTSINDKEIHEGDIMGLGGSDGLYAVGTDIAAVAEEMIAAMADDEAELITLYYGEDVPQSEAEALAEKLSGEYPDCDVELHCGGQPIYYYIVSVE